jgi:Spy/CpxP family protein refolding chaperone
MKRFTKTIMICAAALLAVSTFAALAQQTPAAKPPYTPGLGEFMTVTQVRHAKLWLAGNANNWDLADYEIDELKEGLEDAAKYVPTYKDMEVGKMIESIIMKPISDVESAIKARDRAKFAAAFDKLSESCNSCHQAANRAFIVIQRPASSAFPNQNFSPARK